MRECETYSKRRIDSLVLDSNAKRPPHSVSKHNLKRTVSERVLLRFSGEEQTVANECSQPSLFQSQSSRFSLNVWCHLSRAPWLWGWQAYDLDWVISSSCKFKFIRSLHIQSKMSTGPQLAKAIRGEQWFWRMTNPKSTIQNEKATFNN